MWNVRGIDESTIEMQGESLACESEPGSWGRIRFWAANDLHGETPFDDAELGEGGVQDEDMQGFGLVQIELL